jgi:ygbB family
MSSACRRVYVVLPAAGSGSRMGADRPKQYLELAASGRTVLETTVEVLAEVPGVDGIFVAVSPADETARTLSMPARVLKTGGASRAQTVYQTLEALSHTVADEDLVLVHDAARPLVDPADVSRLIDESCRVIEEGTAAGAVLTIPVWDTVKRVDGEGYFSQDIDRTGLVRVATPQCFAYGLLKKALADNLSATDESSAVRNAGGRVLAVESSARNIKLTRPQDIEDANRLLRSDMQIRIGIGYDSHRLVENRRFILGGIEIPHTLGLAGHSDADALLHAITDAILGAARLGNIGTFFPDTDPRFKDADSAVLLRTAFEAVKKAGWRVGNVDAVVVAQKPKLNPHVSAMQRRIEELLELEDGAVSVKPKTNEKLGFEGREEGVSTQALVLLERRS